MRAPFGRRQHRHAVPVAVAVAIAVHISALGTVEALHLSIIGTPFDHGKHVKPATPAQELATNCRFDAVLASGARATECLAPWHDPDRCLGDVPANFWIDLSQCQKAPGALDRAQEVAMVDPHSMEKLRPIDPEPLLEALKEQEKQKPQVVPPPTPQQPAPPPPVQARRQPMQVVENAKPNTEQAPDNARFLAEYNTKVEKQTVARGTPKEPMIAKSKPAELAPKEAPKEASVKEHPDKPIGKVGAPDVPGSLAMRAPGAPSPAELPQDAKARGTLNGAMGPSSADFAGTNAPQ